MTRSTIFRRAQLSTEASADIIRALEIWRQAHSLSDYDVAEIFGVSRDTISRWRRRPVALAEKTVKSMIAGIEEYAETAIAARIELERLLTLAHESLMAIENDPVEQLRRNLNEQGLRGNSVLAAIEAAGLSIVREELT